MFALDFVGLSGLQTSLGFHSWINGFPRERRTVDTRQYRHQNRLSHAPWAPRVIPNCCMTSLQFMTLVLCVIQPITTLACARLKTSGQIRIWQDETLNLLSSLSPSVTKLLLTQSPARLGDETAQEKSHFCHHS